MYASEADGLGGVAELGDGGGEAFGVQAGGVAQSAVLVDALAAVGHHQGDQGTRAGHDAEGEFDQVEQCFGVDAAFGLQFACAKKVPSGVEHCGGDQDCSGEGQDQNSTDGPQAQAAPFSLATGWTWAHDRQD
ncbi:hypothetical protein [Streptomyces sp. NPDC020951]|uniref:hypothetical protein n=1 Tax=Streptomyces sp. NPDC020951 TaxID=3365104 RepID=UPI003788DDB8